jgi:hypothetical protein
MMVRSVGTLHFINTEPTEVQILRGTPMPRRSKTPRISCGWLMVSHVDVMMF